MGKPEPVTDPNSKKGAVADPDSKGSKLEESAGRRPMATIEDDDERLLARIGYRQVPMAIATSPKCLKLIIKKQELKREFTKWSTVSYAISILGVLGSVPATFGTPITTGGPATAVWAWFIGSIMAMCIASSGQSNVYQLAN